MSDVAELIENLRGVLDHWRTFVSKDVDVQDWQTKEQLEQIVAPMVGNVFKAQFEKVEAYHDLLAPEEDCQEVIHYTSLDTLVSMLRALDDGQDSFLRMYDSFHLNDPQEGQHLVQFMDSLDTFDWLEKKRDSHAYIASFIIPNQEEDQKSRDEDNLKYWLAYGRRGQGCSIRFPVRHHRIQRVLYGDDDAKRTAEELALQPLWTLLKALVEDPTLAFGGETQRTLSDAIWNSFAAIRYLYKNEAYRYEQECRLVKSILDVNKDDIHFEPKRQTSATTSVRHYYQDGDLQTGLILVTGSIITLGPLVPRLDNVVYSIEALLNRTRLSGPTVNVSKIPYQEPFQ